MALLHPPFLWERWNSLFFRLYVCEFAGTAELHGALVTVTSQLPFLGSHGHGDEQELSAAVRFYETGFYQRPVGEQWGISMSQSSISRSIRSITNAIIELLLRPWVRFTISEMERRIARQEFQTLDQPFEGAIGAIDCSHIAIIAPREHEEGYVNHHGYHSINVQMICDPNLKVLNVNARYPGARNDSYIWSASPVRRIMQQWYERGERETFLIGDQGYPLEPWLMTPLPNERLGTPRFLYNQDFCSARNCVERLFGVVKSTWRCLSKHRVLQYEPGMAGKIVNACAVLHNMRIRNGIQMEMIDENEIEGDNPIVHDADDDDLRPLAAARRVQDRLIRQRYGI
ncbi:putative nuclease HARBI1 [Athalia rosae]|uniref:putative nuclease HARBI1 n=1 Tax=Athalia rosae TaxID=37344 RepID=UPI00203453C1|nr:putative nuclease HARBI1 [Athalia rosae]